MRAPVLAGVLVAACSHAPPPQAPPPVHPQQPPQEPAVTDAPPTTGSDAVTAPPVTDAATGPQHFDAKRMCVTHGSMKQLHVAASSMRAFARGSSGDGGALEFTYTGPTKEVSHLASGDVREQLGLKLRAADGCNLVYVVWRFSPKPELVVQTKINPGMSTNVECGTSGYERVKPDRHASVSRPEPGSKHVLAATIDGDTLTATVDGQVAWTGQLPAAARALHGPLGVRTDNVEADVALVGTAAATGDDAGDDVRCRNGGAD
jgi:hypothetical protein|nr:hypothetical protein [Kofleriaceae bacterium]